MSRPPGAAASLRELTKGAAVHTWSPSCSPAAAAGLSAATSLMIAKGCTSLGAADPFDAAGASCCRTRSRILKIFSDKLR